MSAVEVVARPRTAVGEGPIWDAAAGVVWWVDIKRPAILRFDPAAGRVDRWAMPERVGFVVLRRAAPGFVAGLKSGLAVVTLDGRAATVAPLARYAPAGRLWFGTMDDAETRATGYLHRYVAGGSPARLDGPYVVTNGPAVAADGGRLYHVDSHGRTIWRFTLAADGGLADRTPFVRFEDPAWGVPDGVVCDAADHLWVAHWGGGRLSRFTPDGRLERQLALPTPQITKCCFAGAALSTLYVTSAAIGRGEDDAAAGALFRIETDVTGLAPRRFDG